MIVLSLMSLIAPLDLELMVGNQLRTAVVAAPAQVKADTPVVFVFHGHGGSGKAAQRSFAMEKHWPEALVIYPDGLPTATQRDPEGKKPGWNARKPEENIDLAFFDALLDWAQTKKHVDAKKVYITGHSNGGGFVYLLATQRGDRIRAAAPSSAGPSTRAKEFPMIPVLHLSGQKDPIVPFANQQKCVDALKTRFGLSEVAPVEQGAVSVFKKPGAPELNFYVHPGGHSLPVAAYPLIAEFFKKH